MMREAKSASTQRKATEFVKVRRTSGEVEDGWTVAGQTEDGVTIVKQDVAGGAKIKHIPHGEFYATQKLQIDQMPQRPSGKEKSSVLKKFIGWGKKQKSEDQMTEAKESKLTSRSIAEAGLYTRDQVHIYKPERASDSETDLREAALNMAEAAALLYGRGIDGELPVRLQSGARESLGRIYMKAHLFGVCNHRGNFSLVQ